MGEPMQSAKSEIKRRRDDWIAAINTSDADGFVAVVAEDAVWLPAGRSAINGRDRIWEWVSGPLEEYSYDYSVTNVRLRVAGGWAAEQAAFRTRAVDRSGAEAPVHEGEYTILWRHTPGTGWLIERYIDHTGFDAD